MRCDLSTGTRTDLRVLKGEQMAFSPTHCSVVQMGDNGKLQWTKLGYTDDDFGESMKDGMIRPSPENLAPSFDPNTHEQRSMLPL